MKKSVLALVIGLGVMMGVAPLKEVHGRGSKAETNAWTAPVTITNTIVITTVQVNNLTINVLSKGKIQLVVDWTMNDDNGIAVKTGRSIYTETEVDNILKTQGMSLDILRTMFMNIVATQAVK